MKKKIEDFLREDLGINITVISNKGWARACCPIHAETRPSFGVKTTYPYSAKCFSCNFEGSLPFLTARILHISREKAVELINSKVEIILDFSNNKSDSTKRNVVPDVVAEMYLASYKKSIAERYIKYREIAPWSTKIMEVGYDDLTCSMVVPMRNTYSHKIQGYFMLMFSGTFEEIRKEKSCGNAGETVTIPLGWNKIKSCIVVEGIVDAMRLLPVLQRNKEKLGGLMCPVVLNTAFASREQLRFIRQYERVLIALDHDDAGERGREFLIQNLRDRPGVFDLIYPDHIKDPGELSINDEIKVKLIFEKKH